MDAISRLLDHGKSHGLEGPTLDPDPWRPGPALQDDRSAPPRLTARDHATIRRLFSEGYEEEQILRRLMIDDVSHRCARLRGIYEESGGRRGFAGIPVDPRLARDSRGTLRAARKVAAEVDQPNCLIIIPGTPECLTAFEQLVEEAVSVNLCPVFSPERCRVALEAFRGALGRRLESDEAVAGIVAVTTVFLGRIDELANELLSYEDEGSEARELRGQVASSLAREVEQVFRQSLARPEWRRLERAGALAPCPVWVPLLPGRSDTEAPDPARMRFELAELGIHLENMEIELEELELHRLIEAHEDVLRAIRGITWNKEARHEQVTHN